MLEKPLFSFSKNGFSPKLEKPPPCDLQKQANISFSKNGFSPKLEKPKLSDLVFPIAKLE